MPETLRAGLWLRVSTDEQSVDSQRQELEAFVVRRGWTVVERWVEEGVSGAARGRRVPDLVLRAVHARKIDAVVVFRADRAFRSAGAACLFLDDVHTAGGVFVSIADGIDTSTQAGRFMAKLASVFAEWERSAIKDRVTAGIAAARKRGVQLGRPRRAIDLGQARELLAGGATLKGAARRLKVPVRTLRRQLDQAGYRERKA
jgi:DNA invertase Pin-like site-specific DNA recombinase